MHFIYRKANSIMNEIRLSYIIYSKFNYYVLYISYETEICRNPRNWSQLRFPHS
jgi:hypothetical protein